MARVKNAARVFVAPARVGRGVFAARSFRRGDTVLTIEGRIVNYMRLWEREGTRYAANCIRYGPETYLDPADGPAAYLNHSCVPNVAIAKTNNRLHLVAARRITTNEEIMFDYSTTIGDDDVWRMRCRCGEPSCRRLIRNFGSLPDELREHYLAHGFVPPYIVRTLSDRSFVMSRHARLSASLIKPR
jgi:SET domain-containing protein